MTAAAVPVWSRSRIITWIAAGAGILALALVLRYALIEPHWIGITCSDEAAPQWCAARQAIVLMHIWWVWGWLGLGGGVLAFIFSWPWAVRVGFAMSLMGLVLYNSDYAAVGMVLTLSRLPRV